MAPKDTRGWGDTLTSVIALRSMTSADLPSVARWLREPHVARWWLEGSTAEAELDELRARLTGRGDQTTRMLLILERQGPDDLNASPIGWCQWYPYDAYPIEAEAIGAHLGDCGIDYALGEPTAIRRGLGTQLIAALVVEVRRHHPGCGIVVDPDASNSASRRVLERNGFSLVAIRPVTTELNNNPMAIYRLPDRPDVGASRDGLGDRDSSRGEKK
jgi:aminoglycoside 6'-N-acetyltransferase